MFMSIVSFRQKHPYEWVCLLDEGGLSLAGREVLGSMGSHIGKCFGCVFEVFDISPDDWLALNGLFSRVSERIESGEEVIRSVPENASGGDFVNTLSDLLVAAYWWMCLSLESLSVDRVGEAVKFFACSVDYLARFEVFVDLTEGQSEESGGFSKFNASINGKKGAAVRHKPRNETKKYALDLYAEKSWQSSLEAARKLLPVIVKKGKKIGLSLTDSNAESTIYKWFLAHEKELRLAAARRNTLSS